MRTSSPITVYNGGRSRRVLSGDAPVSAFEASGAESEDVFAPAQDQTPAALVETPVLVEENYRKFKIVRFRRKYIAVNQSAGALDLAAVDNAWLAARVEASEVCIADTLDAVRKAVDDATIALLTERLTQLEKPSPVKAIKRRMLFRRSTKPADVM